MSEKLIISPKKYSGETSVVSARLPNDLIRDINTVAQETGHSRNEIIQLCLEFALRRIEIESVEE